MLEKRRQPRRRLERGDRIERLQRAREGVRERPLGPRLELVVLWLEVVLVDEADEADEVLRGFECLFDEGATDDELGLRVGELEAAPGVDCWTPFFRIPPMFACDRSLTVC